VRSRAAWRRLETCAAPDLIGPATVASRDAGSRIQFTIEVEDDDSVCAELAGRGVTLIKARNRARAAP
jgi:hypothetical protein